MTKKEHNGWFNYETWLVKLWMDNEESSSGYWAQEASDSYANAVAESGLNRKEQAACDLSEKLKENHEQQIEDAGVPSNGFITDLIGAAMSEVNWHEIAESLLGDVEDDEPDFDQWDGDQYDVEAMKIDHSNGNFDPDSAEDYLHENIVAASISNGQFEQAREQCRKYGLNYDLELTKTKTTSPS